MNANLYLQNNFLYRKELSFGEAGTAPLGIKRALFLSSSSFWKIVDDIQVCVCICVCICICICICVHITITIIFLQVQETIATKYNIKAVFIPGLATAPEPTKDSTIVNLVDMISRFRAAQLPSVMEYRSINNKELQYRLTRDQGITMIPYKVSFFFTGYSVYILA